MLTVVASSANAEIAAPEDCYDASVLARISRQTPTVAGNCGEDCIVMTWPWIIQLEVEGVLEGHAKLGRLTVLTVQHTNYTHDLGAVRWWLRRNTLGKFNAIMDAPGALPPRCKSGIPAAEPYVTPAPGQTFGDLQREGARYYYGR